MLDRDRIAATRELIAPYLRQTPVIEVSGRDFGLDCTLIFKLELLQHSGSFKARGAFANLLGREVPPAGVVAASGGNHGAAVAYAARVLGVPAKIFVPMIASPAKLARIESYGAEVVVTGEVYADALAASQRWIEESGALPVHAYDAPETLLGQGTLGAELEAQVENFDCLLVAVGGGGLIGGIAAWLAGRHRLLGVETHSTPSLSRALEAGAPVDVAVGGLAADSLGASRVGGLMLPIAQAFVERVLLVDDEDVAEAQALLWDRLRLVTEPGGAAAFAALLSGAYRPGKGERVCVLLCGANTTAVSFER